MIRDVPSRACSRFPCLSSRVQIMLWSGHHHGLSWSLFSSARTQQNESCHHTAEWLWLSPRWIHSSHHSVESENRRPRTNKFRSTTRCGIAGSKVKATQPTMQSTVCLSRYSTLLATIENLSLLLKLTQISSSRHLTHRLVISIEQRMEQLNKLVQLTSHSSANLRQQRQDLSDDDFLSFRSAFSSYEHLLNMSWWPTLLDRCLADQRPLSFFLSNLGKNESLFYVEKGWDRKKDVLLFFRLLRLNMAI